MISIHSLTDPTVPVQENLPQQTTVGRKKFLADEWGARHTLAILGFFGFVLFYSMRFNLSIAIIPMVQSKSSSLNANASQLVCPNSKIWINQTLINSVSFKNVSRPQSHILKENSDEKEHAVFNWTEKEQGLIMGSFFWGYVITQFPGGRLSHMYGPKWVIGSGILLTGVLSLLLPVVTLTWGKTGLVIIRVLQGLSGGVTFPAMHVLIANWSPLEERSRLTNFICCGIPLGTAVTMLVGGHLVHFFGWESLFYTTGILSILWFILWAFFVFDDPTEHPKISQEELEHIQLSINGQTVQEDLPIPWKRIIKSMPFWSIFIVHIGHTWGHYLMHTETPKYLHAVHNFEIQHTGWFSALPQLLNFGMCIIVSNVSDFLIVNKLRSTVFTRKMCTTLALWGTAAGFLGVVIGGCDTITAVLCLNICGAMLGAGGGGWIVNNIDIAPNYAGTIMGVMNSVSNTFGFISPYITGTILDSYPSLMGWRIAFLIPAVLNFISNIFYLMFASADEQPWNRPVGDFPTIYGFS